VVDPICVRENRNNLTMIPLDTKFVAAPTVNSPVLPIRVVRATYGLNRSSGPHATIGKLLLKHKLFAVNTVQGSVPRMNWKLTALVEQVVITTVISSGVLRLVLQAKKVSSQGRH